MIVMIVLLYATPAMFDIRYNMFTTQLHYIDDKSNYTAEDQNDKGLHYTFLFNTFMMMQLFNQLNCRKLGSKEKNVFNSFFNNPYFLIIILAEFGF